MIEPNLSLILILPLIGLAVVCFLAPNKEALIRKVSIASVLLPFLLSIGALISYDPVKAGFQFVQKIPWVESMGISYLVGVDGINLLLLLLTGIVSLAATLVSNITSRVKEYYILLLITVIGTYGAFLSLDIFFFYFFHEIAAVPVFIMITVWGSERRDYAAIKLTLYLVAGAALALLGFIFLHQLVGINSFDVIQIKQHLASNPLPIETQNWLFPLIVLGFGITLTLWPFHTWAPVGYAEAPTAVSMLHAGVLKKMGAYAIIRFAIELMPDAAHTWMPIVATLAVVNILFCGLIALTQRDMKYILGYSSCSHMGYIFLGLACLNTIGLTGAVFLMLAHGIMASLAFALTGFISDQARNRNLDGWGGIIKAMPFIGTCFMMTALASAGVPGFANFVSEIMVLLGAWDKYPLQTVLAILGIVITAIYMLKAIRLGLHGPLNPQLKNITDAKSALAKFPYVMLLAALIVIGCWPSLVLKHIDPNIKPIVNTLTKN